MLIRKKKLIRIIEEEEMYIRHNSFTIDKGSYLDGYLIALNFIKEKLK